MVDAMKQVAAMKSNLSFEERNLLSVAYKNIIGARRASWRIITGIEEKEQTGSDKKIMSKSYRAALEKEISDICVDILDVIENHLLKNLDESATDAFEAKVFYKKM